MPDNTSVVNTVLGPVPADQLGPTVVHASLLSVFPGAEYAPDITIDRAEIFNILRDKLNSFYAASGRTIVDVAGMFHGRNLPFTLDLLEILARTTGVNNIASTGMGPEEMLGGYFLTPRTNPPTPWPAEKFADLFTKEITEGMVVPRVERRQAAGLIVPLPSASGMTATDESLLRGAVRAAKATGVAVSHTYGADLLAFNHIGHGTGSMAWSVHNPHLHSPKIKHLATGNNDVGRHLARNSVFHHGCLFCLSIGIINIVRAQVEVIFHVRDDAANSPRHLDG